jgi:GxxExxY protein
MMRKETKLDPYTEDLAYNVIGAAIEVHRELGPGLLESIYEGALCIELSQRKIAYERQKEVLVMYKGEAIGNNRVDVLVDNRIILELKSVERLLPVHEAQLITYLKISSKKLGFLINFNTRFLKEGIRRFVL